ncbi:MAG: zinc ribbon domain-containing protein [Firmicutes bacterium]|nr:zinc ribbon domain-containing protein [Bacillota bacterium]
MNCKKCGAPLVENDQFCKSCGAAVNETSAQNNVGGSQPTFTQNEFGGAQQPMNNGMGGQPMNNYQQPTNGYMNSYNSQPMYNQPPKSNNTKFILIGIGVAVAVVVVAILIFALGGNDNNAGGNYGGTNDGGTTINNKSTYTVNFKGFTFKIPTDLVYETQSDAILLGDEDGTWASYIEVIEGSYNQLLSNKNQLQGIYQQQGFTSSAAATKTVGGLDFITLEISKGGQNALLGLAKANSMNVFGITAYTQANDFDYDLLETVSSILKTAEFNNATNNMSGFEKVDMSGISGLAQ